MDKFLENDKDFLPGLLDQANVVAKNYLAEIDVRPAATNFERLEPLALPSEGHGAEQALRLFQERYASMMPASNGPRFWGFVTGGTTPAALLGDWLTSVYDLNLSSAANSPAPNIEYEAISFLRELFGLPATFHGTFVTGATMSNLVGLALGREWVGQQTGHSVAAEGLHAVAPITVLSSEAHSSIYKALAILGLGRNSLQKIPLQPNSREAVDTNALRRALEKHAAPAVVVANAGTVNTVDFDDVAAIAALKKEFDFWLHVDAAFGGFAACSSRYRHLLQGIEAADSITIDAHKWLNTPYDSAMIFTRHRQLQTQVFLNQAAYLGELGDPPDFVHLGPENSRRMRALPAWFTLLAYGRTGYQEIVERNCDCATLLGEKIAASRQFRLLAPVRMNVVCFTLAEDADRDLRNAVSHLLARLRTDGRVFLTPTTYQGIPAMRAAFSNWRTTIADVEIGWQAMIENV